MLKGTFFGGIHPFDGKEMSKNKPIVDYVPKGDMVYPLQQHLGAPAVPVVGKGDYVRHGQLIAEAGGFVSAPVYAACSGYVKTIEPHLTVSGDMVESIIIENDGKFTPVEQKKTEKQDTALTPRLILERIQKAGVVGMGGAGFPTHVKLAPKNPEQIDYIIVNCSECEPYLTSDYRRMIENPEMIIEGLEYILAIFPHAKGIIAVEDNKADAAVKLEKLCINKPAISVSLLKTKYPQGSERQLIYACTGRKINSSMLPADGGCIVQNTDTVCAVRDAVAEEKPLMYRIVTVTGDAVKNPVNFRVPIGTSYAELAKEAGGFVKEPAQIISGGPLMGISLFDIDVPVIKTSSALLCLTENDVRQHRQTACINCGRCADACPEQLMPMRLLRAAEASDRETFLKLYGMECIECGACSYICPAKQPLTHTFRTMRRNIMAEKKRGGEK